MEGLEPWGARNRVSRRLWILGDDLVSSESLTVGRQGCHRDKGQKGSGRKEQFQRDPYAGGKVVKRQGMVVEITRRLEKKPGRSEAQEERRSQCCNSWGIDVSFHKSQGQEHNYR